MPKYNVQKRGKKNNSQKIINEVLKLLTLDNVYKIVVLIAAFALAGLVALKLYLGILPPITNLSDFKPNIVTKFLSADGEVIKTYNACTFSKVEAKDVPKEIKEAIVATEDKNFYRHPGYDLFGVARSMIENILAGRVVQGGSTLTQQLSRMLFLSNEKSYIRKIKEIIIAAQIEKSITKDEILTMYLNNVYLGSGAYGVEGAAQIYFAKHLSELTLAEKALLAGLPQAPSVYSPFNNPKLAIKRRNQVLLRMYKMKYISKSQMKQAQAEELHLTSMPTSYLLNKAPYFCDMIMKELEKQGFSEREISQGGYKIITTLDYKTQIKTNEAMLKIMNAYGLKGVKNQAAVFSFSPIDGRILAYAGGKDYSQSQYDRVTQAIRPPGSAFKPFPYTAAIEKGVSPNELIADEPFTLGDWSPHNYGNKYRGEIPVYKALMISSNVCAVRIIQYVGVRAVIQTARIMGITTPIEYDYTIALGSNGVKLYELTRAYGILANGGFKVEPYGIERIESSRGKVLYSAPKPRITKVLRADTAAIMTAMLRTVVENGTGMAARIGKPAAGKTGTTDDYKDAWFVGYTPTIVTGVWVGNDDNTRMGGLTGGTVPALIWRDIMKVAVESIGSGEFQYPKLALNAKGEKGRPELSSKNKSRNTLDPNLSEDEEINSDIIPLEQNESNKSITTDEVTVEPIMTPLPKQINPPATTPTHLTPQQNLSSTPRLDSAPIPEAMPNIPIPMATPNSVQ